MDRNIFLILITTILLTGCSTGKEEFDKLCSENSGSRVLKSVDAKGYYWEFCKANCWFELVADGMIYVEFENKYEYSKYIPSKGFWKVEIVKKRHGVCDEKINKNYNSRALPEDKCFALTKIERPGSRYMYRKKQSELQLNNLAKSRILKTKYEVYDLEKKEVVSDRIDYLLDMRSGTTLDGGPFRCDFYSTKKIRDIGLIQATFEPQNYKTK